MAKSKRKLKDKNRLRIREATQLQKTVARGFARISQIRTNLETLTGMRPDSFTLSGFAAPYDTPEAVTARIASFSPAFRRRYDAIVSQLERAERRIAA